MHAVFLGLAKHSTKTWKERDIIGPTLYPLIQDRVDQMVIPSKIGRIPRKIGAGFASFTADEWKHWILIFSLYALFELIPEADCKCWGKFVLACRLLCLPVITRSQVNEAHVILADFCRTFEMLYGKERKHARQTCTCLCILSSACWILGHSQHSGAFLSSAIMERWKVSKSHGLVLRSRCSPSF